MTTSSQRRADHDARKHAAGYTRISVWVPDDRKDEIKRAIADLVAQAGQTNTAAP